MSTHHNVKLPVLHSAAPAKPLPFAIGASVALVNCPGQAGTVKGMSRGGKIIVAWHGLNYTGRHSPDRLKLAEDAEHPTIAPQRL
jgi:hypothetical protein